MRIIVGAVSAVAVFATGAAAYFYSELQARDKPGIASEVRPTEGQGSSAEMAERQRAARRMQNGARNIFLTGTEKGGTWRSKKAPGVICVATLDEIYYERNGVRISEAKLGWDAFGRAWDEIGCESSAPIKDPDAPIWHPFPDDIDAQDLAKAARALFRQTLRDYESARYRNVLIHYVKRNGQKNFVMCGEVNSKNGFGGYVGWKVFAVALVDGYYRLGLVSDEDIGGLGLAMGSCVNDDESKWILKKKFYSRYLQTGRD